MQSMKTERKLSCRNQLIDMKNSGWFIIIFTAVLLTGCTSQPAPSLAPAELTATSQALDLLKTKDADRATKEAEAVNTPQPPPRADEREFEVMANQRWQQTGVVVQEGDKINIRVNRGRWSHGREDPVRPNPFDGEGTNKYDRDSWLPNERTGALLGRIGSTGGEPFLIGNGTTITAGESGELELVMNEPTFQGAEANNEGSLIVYLLVQQR